MRNPYARLYDAKMDVYRWTDVEIDGITKQVRTAVATERPCRYSSQSVYCQQPYAVLRLGRRYPGG